METPRLPDPPQSIASTATVVLVVNGVPTTKVEAPSSAVGNIEQQILQVGRAIAGSSGSNNQSQKLPVKGENGPDFGASLSDLSFTGYAWNENKWTDGDGPRHLSY